MNEVEAKRLKTLLRHCENVRENCQLLGENLIEQGEASLGLALIANGRVHDASKFTGIEWLYLHADVKEEEPFLFKAAALQHVMTNRHHPEAWVGGIEAMDDLYLAEMVCDWAARSSEFGDDVWEWVREKASVKYGYTRRSNLCKKLESYLSLLLEPKFK